MKIFIRFCFIMFCGFLAAFLMFYFTTQPPIHYFTQLFNTFTDASQLPENYTLKRINAELLPNLRWNAIWGFFGGLLAGVFMILFYLSFKQQKAQKQLF